jgi:hypothetical protein
MTEDEIDAELCEVRMRQTAIDLMLQYGSEAEAVALQVAAECAESPNWLQKLAASQWEHVAELIRSRAPTLH